MTFICSRSLYSDQVRLKEDLCRAQQQLMTSFSYAKTIFNLHSFKDEMSRSESYIIRNDSHLLVSITSLITIEARKVD